VQIERDPGHFSYVAAFASAISPETPPAAEDVRLSRAEGAHFAQLAVDLALAGLPAATAVERIQRHFRDNFRYATFQARPAAGQSPVVDFMERTRAGHCEYFATATVLLLRAAGVPARYATGFAVLEHSNLEGAWIVRQRHAHAWVRAYVNDVWIDIDTTPPEWAVVEAGAASAWSALTDLWSWLRFRAARAWSGMTDHMPLLFVLLAAPLAAWLGWRLYRSRGLVQKTAAPASDNTHVPPGADSELYLVERRLALSGWGRRPYETAGDWVQRLCSEAPFDASALREILELHCRYRFDPAGIDDAGRARLKASAAAWLARSAAADRIS
jgi:hypothetical protein